MNAALDQGAPAGAHAHHLLAELHHADHIIKVMLNAMTGTQKAKVHEQLAAAGVSGDGMTRENERLAVIRAAQAGAEAASASRAPVSPYLRAVEARAVDVLMQADHADILLKEVFRKLDELDAGDDAPALAAIDCFATCTARAVSLMREAADNIVTLMAEGGAA